MAGSLNFNHLLYFWTTARQGSMAEAGRELGLAPPTISEQIRRLETALGVLLFERRGRSLELTTMGRLVYEYADEIFALGREMNDAIEHEIDTRPLRVRIGVVDVVPKLLSRAVIEPVFALDRPVHVIVREGSLAALTADLAAHRLDVVIAESPLARDWSVQVHNHRLGDSEVGWFGIPALQQRYQEGFPVSMNDAPILMPTMTTEIRPRIDAWFARHRIVPRMVGEFDDTALSKAFAEAGHGLVSAPVVLIDELERQYGLKLLGILDGVKEYAYAISLQRRITHPGVLAMTKGGRSRLGTPRSATDSRDDA